MIGLNQSNNYGFDENTLTTTTISLSSFVQLPGFLLHGTRTYVERGALPKLSINRLQRAVASTIWHATPYEWVRERAAVLSCTVTFPRTLPAAFYVYYKRPITM